MGDYGIVPPAGNWGKFITMGLMIGAVLLLVTIVSFDPMIKWIFIAGFFFLFLKKLGGK